MYIQRLGSTSSFVRFGQLLFFVIGCVGQLLIVNNTTPTATLQNTSAVAAPAAAVTEYVVYPGAPEETSRLQEDIDKFCARCSVHTFRNSRSGVEFWIIEMNASEYKRLSLRNPSAQIILNEVVADKESAGYNVSNTEPLRLANASESIDASAGVNWPLQCQEDAPTDLKIVSWPRTRVFDSDPRCYTYDVRGGREVVIYVIENGVTNSVSPTPPEFAPDQIRFIYGAIGGPGYPTRWTPTDSDPNYHGSCVASKAAGAKFGVSKGTRLIVPKSSEFVGDVSWAWYTVRDDILANPGRRAVIVAASGSKLAYTPEMESVQPWINMRRDMQTIINDGDGVIVVPAGNARRGSFRKNVDILPPLFDSRDIPLIVVGSVDKFGNPAPSSQGGPRVSVWAPGENIECLRFGDYSRDSGTSFAAAMVAGLSAYFLGFQNPPFVVQRGKTAANLKKYLQKTASWRRRPLRGPNVIWNTENGFKGGIWNISDSELSSNISVS